MEDRKSTNHRAGGYRSLFWPLLLIGIGVLWLLGNLGVIGGANLAVLFRLWPLLLIAIGLDLLVGRGSPQIGALIGGGTVVLVIVLMLVGPGLGLAPNAEIQTGTFETAVGDAEAADVQLNLSIGETTVTAIEDSPDLIQADLRYVGEIDFEVSGGTQKFVSLSSDAQNVFMPFDFLGWIGQDQTTQWDIALTRDIPLTLQVNGGVGSVQLDLDELILEALTVNGGVGDTTVSLPAQDDAYTVTISGGTGNTNIELAAAAAVTINLGGGVGDVTLNLPDDAAVRVTADTGVGDVYMPNWLTRTSGEGDDGTWESADFDNAAAQIIIDFDGGVGSLRIR